MKLKEYASLVSLLAKHHPDLEVIYSSNGEGKTFHPVQYAPITGVCVGTKFQPYTDIKIHPFTKLNAVCIN